MATHLLLTFLLGWLTLSDFARAFDSPRGQENHTSDLGMEATRVFSTASFFPEYHSQRVTVKYAPVVVPPMTENDGMGGFFEPSTTLPCRDCLVTWMQMGLEHADGTPADANTGMWLHHGVMVNRNRSDAVCGPGTFGQRFFASGNERTAVDLSADGTVKAGYYIGPSDHVALAVDLMNMLHSKPQDNIVVTVTYEFIQGKHPHEFTAVTPYWLDVGGCETSNVPAYPNTTFEYVSPSLKGSLRGPILFVAGHLHDGGTHIDLTKNGEVLCSVNAVYDQYQYLADDDARIAEHISAIETCKLPGSAAPGDEWSIEAYYDTSLHEPMSMMDGSLEPVMGIMLVYVAPSLEHHGWTNTKCMNVVLALASAMVLVLLVAAWFWLGGYFSSKKSSRLVKGGITAKDWEMEREAAMPLIGN